MWKRAERTAPSPWPWPLALMHMSHQGWLGLLGWSAVWCAAIPSRSSVEREPHGQAYGAISNVTMAELSVTLLGRPYAYVRLLGWNPLVCLASSQGVAPVVLMRYGASLISAGFGIAQQYTSVTFTHLAAQRGDVTVDSGRLLRPQARRSLAHR